MSSFDLIGVGSPIMDLLAQVPDDFLHRHVAGEKGGMVLVDDQEMGRIVGLLGHAPARTTGGSAANATFNAARLGLRATFLGKLATMSWATPTAAVSPPPGSTSAASNAAPTPTPAASPSSPRTPSARCGPSSAPR